ncbi:M23 family metallopeptidase [Chryseosolibacter indicus]|uniref:M23 family metallopeptidase n=1 Tax=Chryseosolibacter indicus TaxID=2782351 RepID=A0ABS5VYV5_9BACT|nr:M23 family metallopeptidase [Chryseosolibacter indicus]MBT1705196.1 M23 family metallopeptidase [Chryseosolibacter indicus]
MRKVRYTYNRETCKYEPFYVNGRTLRNHVLTFIMLSLIIALGAYLLSIQHFESLDELLLKQKNEKLKVKWNVLHRRIEQTQQELAELIRKDDYNYRIILDSNPLESSIREAGIGGSEKINTMQIKDFPYIVSDFLSLQKIKHQVQVEVQSYDDLEKILTEKLLAWSARPAIQPVSNKQLQKLHLTYGLRLHPIFKVWKDHKGLDFAAPHGTPVYATGDGKVVMAYFSGSYGNVLYIDHGYNFETRYAHLSKFQVKQGETVKRGQLIGYVGNTGNSVSSHLHYEVLYNAQHVNPINFFQRDLSNEEYQKLIDNGSENSFSLD